ncbi:MAG: DUF1573 domain-containing protein [Candidatus Omnitrophica bacterium]|nr:DUF1573 domain-containing protein [Candidatus Omnitrophota bacterium]
MFPRKNLLIFLCIFAGTLYSCRLAYPAGLRKLTVFYSTTCHKCLSINQDLMPQIEEKFKDSIEIDYRDIAELENYKLLLGLEAKYGVNIKNTLPVFYMEDSFLNGEGQLSNKLEWFISEALKNPPPNKEELPRIDLVSRFNNFRPLAIAGAGLIDGINPCAFTVIVFFISFLALQRYKKREIALVGLAFILSVFLTYILIGLGLFGFLYRLKGFLLVSRIINLGIGLLCFVLAGLALYDLFKFIKTKSTEELTLQLPESLKNRIHAIIGLHYRKSKLGDSESGKRSAIGLLVSALITGFLVSIIEAVCTGQVYLPTLVFILKTTPLKLRAAGYILLYNIMFILPLFIIFLFALWGVTSEQFAKVMKKHLAAIKIIMAILFFGLGLTLVYSQAPEPLRQSQPSQESEEWDFGQVKEGELVRHTFLLRNKSRSILNIKQVSTSCGCTLSKVKKNVLAPGEVTPIEVAFDSKGYSGQIKQYVYAHTDSLDNPVIRFIMKGNVLKGG